MNFGSGVAGGVAAAGPPSVNPLPGITQRVAGEALAGHRAVWVSSNNEFYVADPTNDDCVEMICGITTGSANGGTLAFARFTGELVDPSFNFSPGPVYLGPGGTLTQNCPTSGNLVLLGNAAGPMTLHVRIEFVCKLS